MRRVWKYDCNIVFSKLPTLAEAMEHYRQTGEFILSARNDDAYDSDSSDIDVEQIPMGVIDVVGNAQNVKSQRSPVKQADPISVEPSPDTGGDV